MKWNVSAYVDFLNTHDWSSFYWTQPATWSDSFWPVSSLESTLDDMLGSDELIIDADSDTFGLDGLDELLDQNLLDEGADDFGFVTSDAHNAASSSSDNSTIQQLIEQRK